MWKAEILDVKSNEAVYLDPNLVLDNLILDIFGRFHIKVTVVGNAVHGPFHTIRNRFSMRGKRQNPIHTCRGVSHDSTWFQEVQKSTSDGRSVDNLIPPGTYINCLGSSQIAKYLIAREVGGKKFAGEMIV